MELYKLLRLIHSQLAMLRFGRTFFRSSAALSAVRSKKLSQGQLSCRLSEERRGACFNCLLITYSALHALNLRLHVVAVQYDLYAILNALDEDSIRT